MSVASVTLDVGVALRTCARAVVASVTFVPRRQRAMPSLRRLAAVPAVNVPPRLQQPPWLPRQALASAAFVPRDAIAAAAMSASVLSVIVHFATNGPDWLSMTADEKEANRFRSG